MKLLSMFGHGIDLLGLGVLMYLAGKYLCAAGFGI